jgi:hypothetical protein
MWCSDSVLSFPQVVGGNQLKEMQRSSLISKFRRVQRRTLENSNKVEEKVLDQDLSSPRELKIASTLSWFWGILLLVSSIALGMPMASQGGPLVLPILLVVLAILFCVAGHGVRKQRLYASWLAVVSSIASCILLLLMQFRISPIGILIGLMVTILIIRNWKSFH